VSPPRSLRNPLPTNYRYVGFLKGIYVSLQVGVEVVRGT
jgi:hypothetical protein